MEEYNIDDVVVWTGHLGRVIGKTTGGKVEIFIEKILANNKILAQLGTNKAVKIGMKILLADQTSDSILEVIKKEDGFFELLSNRPVAEVITKFVDQSYEMLLINMSNQGILFSEDMAQQDKSIQVDK